MKRPIAHRKIIDHRKYPITGIVEGWFFRIDELSQGYYRVEGTDEWNHSISRDGIDPDQLLNACKVDILEMFHINDISLSLDSMKDPSNKKDKLI